MVSSGGDVEERSLFCIKDACHDGHIREMSASCDGMVAQQTVRRSPSRLRLSLLEVADLVLDSLSHGAKMDWKVRRIRY